MWVLQGKFLRNTRGATKTLKNSQRSSRAPQRVQKAPAGAQKRKEESMNISEAQEYICDIQKFAKKNTLEHTKQYLKLLGNPCRDAKIIHVAGTNGKGSVCNYLRMLLQEHGYHTAMFVSPHLVDMRERMLLDGEMVSSEQFMEAFVRVQNAVESAMGRQSANAAESETDRRNTNEELHHPTFFEFLFLMAMCIFDKAAPDYIILETGMGGRLDATNVFDKPKVTVITEIGLDHCRYLGETKQQIAAEKAGIIKKGVPLVYVEREKNVSEVLKKKAEQCDSETFIVDKTRISNVNINHKSIDFSYKSRYYNNVSCTLSTRALYQTENAAVALTALEVLFEKEQIDLHKVRSALAKAGWAGRMEEVADDVYVDGAHNEDGITAFLSSVESSPDQRRRILLFSVVSDKEYETMIHRVEQSGLFEAYIIAGIEDNRGLSVEQIVSCFKTTCKEDIHLCESVRVALDTARALKGEGVVYVAGSLYLAGEIKALLAEELR